MPIVATVLHMINEWVCLEYLEETNEDLSFLPGIHLIVLIRGVENNGRRKDQMLISNKFCVVHSNELFLMCHSFYKLPTK